MDESSQPLLPLPRSVKGFAPVTPEFEAFALPLITVFGEGTVILSGTFAALPGASASHLVKLRLGEVAPWIETLGADGASLHARVHGVVGGRYAVESSADLRDWQPEGEVRLEGYDTQAGIAVPHPTPERFFRLRSQDP